MHHPPLVKDHPQLQMLKWTFRPIEFLEDCAQRYGDCFVAKLGNGATPCTFMSDPEAIAQLFAPHNAHALDAGRGQFALSLVLGDSSTILLDGKEHKRHRQLLMPPFHGERMRAYGNIICRITETVAQRCSAQKQPIVMLSMLSEITLQVILKAIYGVQNTQRDRELIEKLRRFLDVFTSPVVYLIAFFAIFQKDWGAWSPGGRFLKLMQELDVLLFAAIRDRRASLDPKAVDVLAMLLLARDEAGEPMSDQELRDELLALLIAGHDSSAAAFSWVFYYLDTNPQVKARLLDELASLGADPDPMEIAHLPYLSAVCSESLRLRSAVPASTARIANQTVWIKGYEFPPDSVIVPTQHLTHHRRDLYPDPYQFNPDRFLDRRYSASEYYPYGGGVRRCIGSAFASFEMKLVVATLLRRYAIELVDRRPLRTVRRGVNVAPKGGIKVLMTPKQVAAKPEPVAVTR